LIEKSGLCGEDVTAAVAVDDNVDIGDDDIDIFVDGGGGNVAQK
jgi:hypothetical protein